MGGKILQNAGTRPGPASFLEQELDVVRDGGWVLDARVPLVDIALLVDKELLEVPLDALEAEEPRLLGLQPRVERIFVVAVHVNLLHDGEADAVIELAELRNLLGGAWLLACKLVAWEPEHLETLVVVLLVELLEVGVLLCEPTLGGGVDNEHHLALEFREREWLAVVGGRCECVELGHLAGVNACVGGCYCCCGECSCCGGDSSLLHGPFISSLLLLFFSCALVSALSPRHLDRTPRQYIARHRPAARAR